jgi:hypothetical protein
MTLGDPINIQRQKQDMQAVPFLVEASLEVTCPAQLLSIAPAFGIAFGRRISFL